MNSRKILFTKMSGAGNDFLIMDARSQNIPSHERKNLVIKSCHRQLGVGADGVVFIEPAKDTSHDFSWDFYNSDGSHAEMCGNASRCVARYAFEHQLTLSEKVKFLTTAGVIEVERASHQLYKVKMTVAKIKEKKLSLEVLKKQFIGDLVDAGVPHFVVETKEPISNLFEVSQQLRHHPYFQKAGSNVSYYHHISDSEVQAASFERGVENFTLACGTGAVAIAKVVSENKKIQQVGVHMPGGILQVLFEGTQVYLIGPASKICSGEIYWEELG